MVKGSTLFIYFEDFFCCAVQPGGRPLEHLPSEAPRTKPEHLTCVGPGDSTLRVPLSSPGMSDIHLPSVTGRTLLTASHRWHDSRLIPRRALLDHDKESERETRRVEVLFCSVSLAS